MITELNNSVIFCPAICWGFGFEWAGQRRAEGATGGHGAPAGGEVWRQAPSGTRCPRSSNCSCVVCGTGEAGFSLDWAGDRCAMDAQFISCCAAMVIVGVKGPCHQETNVLSPEFLTVLMERHNVEAANADAGTHGQGRLI
jgi:hypothetical protein